MLIPSLLLFAKFYASFASLYYEIIASILMLVVTIAHL
jgi:hypothetical protein